MNSDTSPTGAEAPGANPLPPLPFPRADESDLEHVGTASALLHFGIDVGPEFRASFDDAVIIQGADGHGWHCWAFDAFWVYARRARTAAEREQWYDELNSRTFSSFVSKDRLMMIAHIACDIEEIGGSPLPRSARRTVKAKLSLFGEILRELLFVRDIDMAEMREMLATAGLEVPQPYPAAHLH